MNLTVDIRAEELLARLAGAQDRLSQNMLRVVTRLSVEVQAAVKEKLTGGVLHVRTGTLRRSINRVVQSTGSGAQATIGTNVKYAGVHEFGFDGTVTVKAHTRVIRSPATIAKNRAGVTVRKPGAVSGIANVREYARHMTMPERSFLRSTLRDFADKIRTDIRAAALASITS